MKIYTKNPPRYRLCSGISYAQEEDSPANHFRKCGVLGSQRICNTKSEWCAASPNAAGSGTSRGTLRASQCLCFCVFLFLRRIHFDFAWFLYCPAFSINPIQHLRTNLRTTLGSARSVFTAHRCLPRQRVSPQILRNRNVVTASVIDGNAPFNTIILPIY